MKRLLCLVLACVLALGLIGCVDQHPEDSGAAAADENARPPPPSRRSATG